jgi:signal recognition particle receptor subunit beta
MVQFNFSERTIKAKVVYYGPPQSGKTTNLEQIHRISDPEGANRLISLNTAQDRTLFFDLLPFSLGSVSGYDFKIQLYTVPGQVQYNATRRVVLAGADAVVFVADGQKSMARENLAAFENMKVNLLANRLVPEKVPLVLQYNKQDLEGVLTRSELDAALNPWGRKAFPAVAARGEGVMETFAAVVQDMLAAIALKYNLKEKGLDPQSVPEIVAQAFAAIVQKKPPPAAPAPPRVVIAQPEGTEPAYPGQVGGDVGPVSEELLHRAIRSNVELAEGLAQVVRDLSQGLGSIHAQANQLTIAREDASRGSAIAEIQREVRRLQLVLRDVGQAVSAGRAASGRAPAPPQVPPTPPRGITAAPAAPASSVPPPRPAPPPQVAPPPQAQAPVPPSPVRPPAVPGAAPGAPTPLAPAAGLDRLVAEVVAGIRSPLASRQVGVESRIVAGAALPRCSPAGLRRAVVLLLQGVAATVAPATAIRVRAEKKPVLLRGRDGSEVKRDFVMLAFTHAGGLAEADQQRILKGADPGAIGEAQRLVREMGGFVRFAPLPGAALETRLFLPA